MKQFKLFETEENITSSTDKRVILTNKRIWKLESGFGKARTTSIHLQKVSSVEIQYKSWLWALIIGVFFIVAGLLAVLGRSEEIAVLAVIAGVVLIILYLLSRRHLITVTSDGGTKLNILTKGMSSDDVLDFVNKIEQAKSLIK